MMELENSNQRESAVKTYLYALIILVSSRLIVFSALIFSAKFIPPSDIVLAEGNSPPWYQYLLRWDAGWYLQIVRDGYSFNGDNSIQQSIAFHPLYPMICKSVAFIFRIPDGAALVVVSNVLIFIAILLAFKLIREDYGDDVALYALAALCFFPASLFFSAGYTESLALLLIVCFFLMLKRKRYILASVFVSLTLATRPTSIVLLLPLAWELWRAYSKDIKRLMTVGIPCLILATSGLWLYMLYLWAAFNRPLTVMTSHRAWHGSGSWNELVRVLTLQPFQHLADIWSAGPFPSTLAPWFFLLFVFLLVFFRKLLPPSYLLYTLGVLLMPYLIGSGNVGFNSFTRYLLLAFPVFIIMGEIFKRRVWIGFAVVGLFAALLFMHTAFYAQAYWAG
jgi:Gpi18-like mannosyltransferase